MNSSNMGISVFSKKKRNKIKTQIEKNLIINTNKIWFRFNAYYHLFKKKTVIQPVSVRLCACTDWLTNWLAGWLAAKRLWSKQARIVCATNERQAIENNNKLHIFRIIKTIRMKNGKNKIDNDSIGFSILQSV